MKIHRLLFSLPPKLQATIPTFFCLHFMDKRAKAIVPIMSKFNHLLNPNLSRKLMKRIFFLTPYMYYMILLTTMPLLSNDFFCWLSLLFFLLKKKKKNLFFFLFLFFFFPFFLPSLMLQGTFFYYYLYN